LTDQTRDPQFDTPQPANQIPEVVPERHILPEMPDEQEEFLRKQAGEKPKAAKRAVEAPQFIEPSRQRKKGSTPVAPSESVPVKDISKPLKPAKTVSTPVARPAKPRREGYPLVTTLSAVRSLVVTFAAAVIAATIFMWWTSPDFLSPQLRSNLAAVPATARPQLATRTPIPTPIWFNRIGILAGHTGINPTSGLPDPGATCKDGFFERQATEAAATRVVAIMRGKGYQVDLLEEYGFDRITGYQAAVFLSLHADSCDEFGYGGFKSSYPTARYTVRDADLRLDECIKENYGAVTGLTYRPDNITDNMRLYWHFARIAPTTPAGILELGFLSHDRALLTTGIDKVAQGIVNGLMCFLTPNRPVVPDGSVPTTVPNVTVPTPTTNP